MPKRSYSRSSGYSLGCSPTRSVIIINVYFVYSRGSYNYSISVPIHRHTFTEKSTTTDGLIYFIIIRQPRFSVSGLRADLPSRSIRAFYVSTRNRSPCVSSRVIIENFDISPVLSARTSACIWTPSGCTANNTTPIETRI